MIKNLLLKKVLLLTTLVLLCSSLIPQSNSTGASTLENVHASETEVKEISTNIKLNQDILSNDFDLEKEVANMPSVDQMTIDEKKLFDSLVKEQVALVGLENKEEEQLFAEAMSNFFDATSETYNELEVAQTKLEEEIEENNSIGENEKLVSIKGALNDTFGVQTVNAAQVRIGVKFAGAVLNTAIGFAIGGGVGAIQAYIVKKGKKEAQKLFTRTVVSRLKAWGASKLAFAVGTCVTIALNYLDVGTQIATQLDKRDKRPNNGWIDIY
ncbi:hypothetical protein [Bacillus paramycoides]|uniref:hypothetical protein n=1 Tax=Bacillus paramycoides TaxID=2026194 RepID=UPI002E1E797D|nr:hypothetical protein [Bacillus paramycoides]